MIGEKFTIYAIRCVNNKKMYIGRTKQILEERIKAQTLLEQLEYDILGLPRPDDVIFLHMPYEYAAIIKQSREEALDENESDERHLRNAEKAFLELVESNGYTCIECVEDGRIKTREEIHEEVFCSVRKLIKK